MDVSRAGLRPEVLAPGGLLAAVLLSGNPDACHDWLVMGAHPYPRTSPVHPPNLTPTFNLDASPLPTYALLPDPSPFPIPTMPRTTWAPAGEPSKRRCTGTIEGLRGLR